jgi:hypothetical protein
VRNKSFYIHDYVLKTIEQDTFGHKHIANAVTNSIIHTEPPFIIGIFGGWGTGKSSLLGIINDTLPTEEIETVGIDAWKYTSAKNLQRAFLVHVAREKAPGLLAELRRRLYTSEQETKPAEASKLDEFRKPTFRQIFNIGKTLLFLSLIFLGILFFIFSIRTLLTVDVTKLSSIWEFFGVLDWVAFIDKFMDLLFVPFLLTFVNYLRMYVLQRPITISHERIDADELFSEYFDKVVRKATDRKIVRDKKLVVFVDNLDRLTDDKMVEALESLKTYINNEKCVFVVACDDSVVRAVINKSDRIPRIGNKTELNDQRAGEHYLDKFFQQTFRLPEYMGINLQDFAEKNFANTKLHDKLISEGVDIRNLISIILPTDVSSPRKVKRLLNDFIAIFDIVARRENPDEGGQLRPGVITSKPEFLGKFSTIRSEYPNFYKSLIDDTGILTDLTTMLQEGQDKEAINKLTASSHEINHDSLLAYLRKTQSIMVEDLGPYIWLSQDTLALGLRPEHNRQLRASLSNGDLEQFGELINVKESNEYIELLIKVASRIVDQRLVGIEQQNGTKVLAHYLPSFSEGLRPEIAHVIASLIPQWSLEVFDADEVLNVLKWAHRGFDSQRNRLIDHLMNRLQNSDLRISTFDAILHNADSIEEKGVTSRVQNWLSEILSVDSQSILQTSESDEKSTIQSNIDFAEALINKVEKYREDSFVVEKYFSGSLTEYMIGRLVGGYGETPTVYIGEDGLGAAIENGISAIAAYVESGRDCPEFWNGILRLHRDSGYLEDFNFASSQAKNLLGLIPELFRKQLYEAILVGINDVLPEIEADDSTDWLMDKLALLTELRKTIEQPFTDNEIVNISSHFSKLINLRTHIGILLNFTETYSIEFSASDSNLLVRGVVSSFEELGSDKESGKALLACLINLNNFLEPTSRQKIVKAINTWVNSNNEELIDIASEYISTVESIDGFREPILEIQDNWVGIIQNDPFTLFKSKLEFVCNNVEFDLSQADIVVDRILPHFPFAGEQNKLALVTDEFSRISEKITSDIGHKIFNIVVANIGQYGPHLLSALALISNWLGTVDESQRTNFSNQVYNHFQGNPHRVVEILFGCWEHLSDGEIKRHILQFYSIEPDTEFSKYRRDNVNRALSQISETKRAGLIMEIWNTLIQAGQNAEDFLRAAIEKIDIAELNSIRTKAIDEIRNAGANPQSEVNLRLLLSTNRFDMREIMPAVDLFVNLFGRGNDDIQLAVKYVVPVLKPLGIRNDHKHKLAEAMGQAALRSSDEQNDEIHDKANQLGLKWFSYRKYWK